MSIIINGINLPNDCNSCPCACSYDPWTESPVCRALDEEPDISYDISGRLPECPMRYYPDPQNPKKDGARYMCPSCGKLVGEEAYIRIHKQQFCSDCGQRIDWGDGYHYPKGEQYDERKTDG